MDAIIYKKSPIVSRILRPLSGIFFVSWLFLPITWAVLTTMLIFVGLYLLTDWFRMDGVVGNIHKKAVLITGCDSGFGLRLATLLHKLGVPVCAGCLSLTSDGAIALSKLGDTVEVIAMDVCDEVQVKESLQIVKEKLKFWEIEGLWGVVNNAGLARLGLIETMGMQELKLQLGVNLEGLIRVTKFFLPLVRESQGRVVNIASVAGRLFSPLFSFYSVCKVAVIAFSDCLRLEINRFGVSVTSIEPVMYSTNIVDDCLKCATKSLDHTPDNVLDAYGGRGEAAKRMERAYRKLMKSCRHDIDEVVESIIHALFSTYPRESYSCSTFSSVVIFVCNHLPYFILRYLFTMKGAPQRQKLPKS